MSVVDLTLAKALKGSGSLKLTFAFDDLGEGSWVCNLSTIHLKGKEVADGLEFELVPTQADENGNSKSKTNNTWKYGAMSIDVSDTETIDISEVILKGDAKGNYSAKAGVGTDGSTVLVTQNWTE